MDPRDESLLQDLLDDRLDEAEAEALRRRLQSDSELKEAWDDLQRLRAVLSQDDGVRAPKDFLTRVRRRIAVLPDDGQDLADPASPRGGTPAAGSGAAGSGAAGKGIAWTRRRWATTISAAAAVLLVALSAKLLYVGQRGDEGPALESARHEGGGDVRIEVINGAIARRDGAARRWDLDKGAPDTAKGAPAEPLRGRVGAGAGRRLEGGLGGASSSSPAPTAAPVEAAETAPAGGYVGPGDSVPPGLREPSDSPAPAQPKGGPPRRARDARAKDGVPLARQANGAAPVYTLVAAGYDEGRAQVAVLLLSLREKEALGRDALEERPETESSPKKKAADAKKKGTPELRRYLGPVDAATKTVGGREVLGTLVLQLTPEEAARLATLPVVAGELVKVRRSPVPATPAGPAAPAPPAPAPVADPSAAPPESEPAPDTAEGADAEDADEEQGEDKGAKTEEHARKSAKRVAVRVLILKKK